MKDSRYNALKAYLDTGRVKKFTEIFDIVPKSTIIQDTGINHLRLTNKINHPEKFTVKDILLIAELIGVDSSLLYALIAKAVDKKALRKKNKR